MIKAGFRINAARTPKGYVVSYDLDEALAERAGLAVSGRPVTVPEQPSGVRLYDFFDAQGKPKIYTAQELELVEESAGEP